MDAGLALVVSGGVIKYIAFACKIWTWTLCIVGNRARETENVIEIGAEFRVPPYSFLNLKKVIIFYKTVLRFKLR